MSVYCNPLNFGYRYQFNGANDGSGKVVASREAADPSLIKFKDKYLLFPSMTAGFLYSEDLAHWELYPTKHLPVYDYAPDVRAVGDYLYFCASSHEKGVFYRTKDPFSDIYEKIEGAFPFWDPDLFADDDGRFYFFWGSSTTEPLYGIELDPKTMQPVGEKKELCSIDTSVKGYERNGENHILPRTQEEMELALAALEGQEMPESMKEAAMNYIMCRPYMEGVWVNKHGGKYYLQYGTPSSEKNIYGDGVYVSDWPLGPYTLAKNNPYSYKPGGFLPGAGHGSTMEDIGGDVWHTSTMRICKNHNFERRIGLWPAGYDRDGELFCNQRYGDWPIETEDCKKDPWADPKWMLLSYGAKIEASSTAPDLEVTDKRAAAIGKKVSSVISYGAKNAVNEDVQSWWKADPKAAEREAQWLLLDLGKAFDVHAVQINFADDGLKPELPKEFQLTDALMQQRWIDPVPQQTRWLLEGSLDGECYFTIEDKREAVTDLPHDLVVREQGIAARFLRLTVTELPYRQTPCVSGLRVFGLGNGEKPKKAAQIKTKFVSPLDMNISWRGENAVGYVVNWGFAPDKLYHSYMVFEPNVSVGGLIKDQAVYLRVDSFNTCGITKGEVIGVR